MAVGRMIPRLFYLKIRRYKNSGIKVKVLRLFTLYGLDIIKIRK